VGQIRKQARQYDTRTDDDTIATQAVNQSTPDNPGEEILQPYANHIERGEKYYEDNETNALLAKINTAAQLSHRAVLLY
jgi:hypothetical protein